MSEQFKPGDVVEVAFNNGVLGLKKGDQHTIEDVSKDGGVVLYLLHKPIDKSFFRLVRRAEPAEESAPVMTLRDEFRGDNESLRRSIKALIELSDKGALIPHGIGGHARNLLSAAYHRLAERAKKGGA